MKIATSRPPEKPLAFGRDDSAAAARHTEWLIDEAIMETFPASDPTSPFHRPSAIGVNDVLRGAARKRGPPTTKTLWWIAAGCALIVAGLLAGRGRDR